MVACYTGIKQFLQLLFAQQTHGGAEVKPRLPLDESGVTADAVDIPVGQGASARHKRKFVHPVPGVQHGRLQASLFVHQFIRIHSRMVSRRLGTPPAIFRTFPRTGIDDGTSVKPSACHSLSDLPRSNIKSLPVPRPGKPNRLFAGDLPTG